MNITQQNGSDEFMFTNDGGVVIPQVEEVSDDVMSSNEVAAEKVGAKSEISFNLYSKLFICF